MTLRCMLFALTAVSLIVLPLTVGSASAQAKYPSKSVHWIVGYVPGGTTDILARLMGQYLSEKTGQQFIIENKAGAGNNLAVEAVLAARPTGYTLLLVNPANGINATLYKKLSFNFVKDIAPVGGLMGAPDVMVVNNDVPAKTVKEFIDHVKANPGKVNMASSGNGTSVHMSGELFMENDRRRDDSRAVSRLEPGAHRHHGRAGSGAVRQHAVVDRTDQRRQDPRARRDHREARRAISRTCRRSAETVPGYEASAWFGMGVKAGTPPDVIAYLNKHIEEALADPKMKQKIADLGGAPMGGTPEDFGKIIVSETAKWKKVVEFSGASVE